MPKFFLQFLSFFFLYHFAFGQSDSLVKPLDITMYLAGTFGELRGNHFHSGLDIKTHGETSLPVYAVDDGYVYRIKISRYGYGKALYVKHPSGLVSVYGHLESFSDRINNYIKQKQYKKQSYEIEVFPYKIELPVKKGDIIAYSGNTGGSSGPHLHFELRNELEHPLNPMSYGFMVKDTQYPIVRNVFAYPLDSLAHINNVGKRVKLNMAKKNDSLYIGEPIKAHGFIGFGIDAYDRQDWTKNYNGLYKIDVLVNGLTVFEQVMEEFSFANTKYINAIIDYPYYVKHRKRIMQLWVKPYNLLEIYTQLVNDGRISIKNDRNYMVTIKLSDYNGNTTNIHIPVKGENSQIVENSLKTRTPFLVLKDQPVKYTIKPWIISFNAKSSFEDFYLKIVNNNHFMTIKNPLKPLLKSYTIKYPLSLLPENLQKYAYLTLLNKNKKTYYVSSVHKNDSLVARTKRFGTFLIRYDSIAPVIKPLNFKPNSDLTNYHFLRFYIGDKKSGVKSYQGFIDGQWILMEYDYKTGKLTYNFDDKPLSGHKHHLKILVTDNLGNTRQYSTDFYRKEPKPKHLKLN
ncbi:MAG TPA: M23 family metallopeptidase [Flavobacteriales bacterium]|nr:M23 family metallopeptidase [Flavobacteriales bacterium]